MADLVKCRIFRKKVKRGFLSLTLAFVTALTSLSVLATDATNWQKHYELSSSYSECIQSEIVTLEEFLVGEDLPSVARKRLEKLRRQVADSDAFFQRNAVNKKKPSKLFGRAKDNAAKARDISGIINWETASASGKEALMRIQICYLNYHRDLRDKTRLRNRDGRTVSYTDRKQAEENVYNIARYKGASKDQAFIASVLSSPSSSKEEPWSKTPKFFTRYSVIDKVGRYFEVEDLELLDAVVGHINGLKASCECFDKISSDSVHSGYCLSVKSSEFAGLAETYNSLLESALDTENKERPVLTSGDKKARIKVSDFPEFEKDIDRVNVTRKSDRKKIVEVREGLEQTLLIYLKRREDEALYCSVDAMSSGRTY